MVLDDDEIWYFYRSSWYARIAEKTRVPSTPWKYYEKQHLKVNILAYEYQKEPPSTFHFF